MVRPHKPEAPTLFGIFVLLTLAAALAWWFRQMARQPIADAWAAETDRI